MSEAVALLGARDYGPGLLEKIYAVLDETVHVKSGQKILLKPNLLMAHELSCTQPAVVAAACQWLLDYGCKVKIADSPAFGSCEGVAEAIGLTAAVAPLGVRPHNFSGYERVDLPTEYSPRVAVAIEALEADLILSVPRVKAHSQMRITLAVKNCYGCIGGLRKALCHVRFGKNVERFADCVAALWAKLPHVAALCDGVLAMSVTGPRNGQAFPLGILAASRSAPALDAAVMRILGVKSAPLYEALQRRGVDMDASFPLAAPVNFAVNNFEVPTQLKEVSFSPAVLVKSLIRRIYSSLKS